ncbi:hypothetical protein GF358_01610 [Candidatus Woesearchaeota archaeon]|nr:hypothetical protein [Candidatus Woesearchaeota archaeon]
MNFLVDFVEKSDAFEQLDKLKLFLFAARIKPATFVALKITPKNIGDKFHFEKHLKEKNIVFKVDKPKSYEEIVKIRKNRIVWAIKGTWYGYDLFRNKAYQNLFKKYVSYVKKGKKDKADLTAGRLYGYPSCCVKNYIKENDFDWVKKNYSYYEYYKKLHDVERKFPFIVHTACSAKCSASKKLNTQYRNIIKKMSPKFYKEFTKKKSFKSDFIVEGENNLLTEIGQTPLWIEKDGHEYNLIAAKKFNNHYYLFSHLTKDKVYAHGSLLSGKAEMQYNHADIKINKLKKIIPNILHIRQFKVLGRKY